VYAITFQRKMATYKVPFGRHYLQSLGQTRRVLKGEGEFVGEGAYDQFKELASLFYEETPGVLVHPVWSTTTAWFVGLELEQEPRSDYVKYSFEFWEVGSGLTDKLTETRTASSGTGGTSTSGGTAVYHTVVRGDTLWALAQSYGVTLSAVIAWNPQIKNPNLIYPGQKVRVG
jgi:spore coat assembly protein SafA